MRLMTYNLGGHRGPKRDLLAEVITSAAPDMVLVQEIAGDDPEGTLWALASAAGLDAELAGMSPVAPSGGRSDASSFVGMLFAPTVLPHPSTWRSYGSEMWHTLLMGEVTFRHGWRVRVGSYHAPPARQRWRADEAERVANAAMKPHQRSLPTFVGGDWNGLSADRVRDEQGRWVYHHPDPYPGLEWNPAFVHQCYWETGSDGLPSGWMADRTAGEILWAAGMRDTAALAGPVDPVPTVGFAPGDPHPRRAIDTVRVNQRGVPAVRGHQVLDTDQARRASDHLPVVVDLDLTTYRGDDGVDTTQRQLLRLSPETAEM